MSDVLGRKIYKLNDKKGNIREYNLVFCVDLVCKAAEAR